jgi:lysophospholipase L1-like esterase
LKLDEAKYRRIREISPWRIFYILLAVNVFLAIFVLLFPNGEHKIGDRFRLQFTSAKDLIQPSKNVHVNLDTVLKDVEFHDSTEAKNEIIVKEDSAIKMPELNKRIQFPTAESNSFDHLFDALYALEEGENHLFRILHYGDSQLEGDRISDYLRNKLQLRFGGSGPGIILPIDVSKSRNSVRQSESGDWRKYAIYGRSRQPNRIYGIGGASFVYTGTISTKVGEDTAISLVYDSLVVETDSLSPIVLDSNLEKELPDTSPQTLTLVPFDSSMFHYDTVIKNRYESKITEESWLRFRCARKSFPLVRTFNKVELLYTSNDECILNVQVDGKSFIKKLLPTTTATKVTLFEGLVGQEVMLRFSGPSPILFGVFLDGNRGIAVDNFPMRGSSGTGYEFMKKSLYGEQLSISNVRLIIMQYGINVVPNPTSNYNFYQRLFLAQLKAIRKAAPNVDILVIGPSDMSRKSGGKYVSYSNIPKIRDAMRNAAFEADCAFWDLYSTMGGENSMVSWVQNSPSLASKDFTHFNSRGARYVSEMLYDALLSEYLIWKKNKSSGLLDKT